MSDEEEFHGFEEDELARRNRNRHQFSDCSGGQANPRGEQELIGLMRRLLQLRNDAEFPNNQEDRRERHLHPDEVSKLIPTFSSGRDVRTWCANVNHFKSLYRWTDQTTLLYASCRLEGAAREWYRSAQTGIANWAQFQQKIQVVFPDNENEAEVHLALANLVKSKDESYEHFVFRVEAMAARVQMSEIARVTYIVRGLSLDPIYDQICANRYNNSLELLNHIRLCEANNNMKRKRQATMVVNRSAQRAPEVIQVNGGETQQKRKCFNCNRIGHLSVDCPQPQRVVRCSKCQRAGHEEGQCNQPVNQARNPRTQQDQRQMQRQREVHLTEALNEEPSAAFDIDDDGRFQASVANQIEMDLLLDTGSEVSLLKRQYVPSGSVLNPVSSDSSMIVGLNNVPVLTDGVLSTTITCKSKRYEVDFLVVSDGTMKINGLVGRKFLKANKVDKIIVHPRNVDAIPNNFDRQLMSQVYGNVGSDCDLVSYNMTELCLDIGDDVSTLSLTKMITEVFRAEYVVRPRPVVPMMKHSFGVKLKEDKVYHASPQRLSVFERRELDKMISELLESGVIRESSSPYSSKVVLTKKKNGSYRLCVNFRALNKLVERDHYPIPVIEDQISKLQNKRYFTSLDLKNGFHHVEIDESSRKYFSFVVESGQYEYTRMPFGYCNAPEIFVRYINKMLSELIKSGTVIVFYDDILLATETIEEHVDVLKTLLRILSDNHVQLNLSKCHFMKTRIEYLGYDVAHNSIQPSDRHVDAIREFPLPDSVRAVQRFIGLVSYFRKFIPNFSKIASPLYDLLKKDEPFVFGPSQKQSFDTLCQILASKPVLAIYSPDAETQLHTDASSNGFGGILMQRTEGDKYFHPVMYFSKRASVAENKLHSFELETLAIVYSLKRFRNYLVGLHFKIVTDCSALQQTLNKKDLNPKISRWALFIEQFDYEIVHRVGDKMQHVDALSRAHVYALEGSQSGFGVEESAMYVNQLKDEGIQKVKRAVEEGKNDGFTIIDQIVYKVKGKKNLLFVPQVMEASVMYKYHNELGHFGVDKVADMIMRNFYIPNLTEKLKKHISECITCISYNPKQRKTDGFLHIYEKPDKPFQTIHIDHLGPLEKTKGKNLHILAVCDSCTKFLKLYAVKSTNTKEVMKCLKSYFISYSVPRVVVSDRGSAFTSKEFESFARDHGFYHVQVATACPKANGQIERYNRTLIPLLAKLQDGNKVQWDNILYKAEHLLNNTLNRSIGDIPSRVLFGVTQKLCIDKDLLEFVEDLNTSEERNLTEIRCRASGNVQRQQKYNKRYYDSKVTANSVFRVGDLVLIRSVPTVGENQKLKPKYKGPYVIKKVLDHNRYVISDIDKYQVSSRPFTGIFDPSNMKLYQKSNSTAASAE